LENSIPLSGSGSASATANGQYIIVATGDAFVDIFNIAPTPTLSPGASPTPSATQPRPAPSVQTSLPGPSTVCSQSLQAFACNCTLPPIPSATCVNGQWMANGTIIPPYTSIDIQTTVHVQGNLTLSTTSTVQIEEGGTLVVDGCLQLDGKLVIVTTRLQPEGTSKLIALTSCVAGNFSSVAVQNNGVKGSDCDINTAQVQFSQGQLSALLGVKSTCGKSKKWIIPVVVVVCVIAFVIVVIAVAFFILRKDGSRYLLRGKPRTKASQTSLQP